MAWVYFRIVDTSFHGYCDVEVLYGYPVVGIDKPASEAVVGLDGPFDSACPRQRFYQEPGRPRGAGGDAHECPEGAPTGDNNKTSSKTIRAAHATT